MVRKGETETSNYQKLTYSKCPVPNSIQVEYFINYTLITAYTSELPIANLIDDAIVDETITTAAETSTTTSSLGFFSSTFGVTTERLETTLLEPCTFEPATVFCPGENCPCHRHGGGEQVLSRCTAWPIAYMMCDVTDGSTGWQGTGKEPCWKGQDWLDAYNSAFYTLAFHPSYFEQCIKEWVNADDYWKLLGPGFQCHCVKGMEEMDMAKSAYPYFLPEGTCAEGPKDADVNPTGLHTDCSLLPQGARELIYPMPITMMQMFANRLDSTEKYVELIKWSRETIEKYEKNTGFPSFPTGIPIIFWEQYVTLWDTVSQIVIIMSVVVYAIMAFTFLFIQPKGVNFLMKIVTALWTSFILIFCILMITFSLVCLMGFTDIWLNGIPAVTLIVSVGVAVEFTAHLCFAYLQATGSAADRTKHAINHMFKPLVDGAISTGLGIVMLATTAFIFVFKYFFLLYTVLTAGGLVVGLVLLPCLLGLVGLPAHVGGDGGGTTMKSVTPV